MSDVLRAEAGGSQKVNIKQAGLNELNFAITAANATLAGDYPVFDHEQANLLEGSVYAEEGVAQQARIFRVQSTSIGVFAETAVPSGVLEATALAEGEGTEQAPALLLRVTLKAT